MGEGVFLKEGGRGGEQLLYAAHQVVEIETVLGRYRYDFGLRQSAFPVFDQRFELRLILQQVDLVDDENHRNGFLRYALEKFRVFVGSLYHVGNVEQNVGIGQGRLGEVEHRLLQLVVGREYPRCVGIDDLHLVGIDDAHDAMSRSLGFGGDNRDAFAHERVHQGRFSYVGVSYDVYKSGFMHGHGVDNG